MRGCRGSANDVVALEKRVPNWELSATFVDDWSKAAAVCRGGALAAEGERAEHETWKKVMDEASSATEKACAVQL